MTGFWISFSDFTWIGVIDIILVAIIVYYFYLAVHKTRALPVFQGIVFIIILTVFTSYLKLGTLSYLLQKILELLFFAVVILFPAEIRRGLYQIGQKIFLSKHKKVKRDSLDIIISATSILSKEKTGAIIIIEKNDRLQGLLRSGSEINANIDRELLLSIFQKTSPLHDGAVVVGNNMLLSAGCYISSLSDDLNQIRGYGSRHRAGLGISEESDAAVIIISEEKGAISLAYQARIKHRLSEKVLKEELYRIYRRQTKGGEI